MASSVTLRVGAVPQSELSRELAPVKAAVMKAIAQAAVERVQKRVNHPAADALRAVGINQHESQIGGPRGGPGVIRPVRAQALAFAWPKAGGDTFVFASVNGVGLGPLIEAEVQRVTSAEVNTRIT